MEPSHSRENTQTTQKEEAQKQRATNKGQHTKRLSLRAEFLCQQKRSRGIFCAQL
jgi:hypothetical protein